jgi:hypothetical protein
MYAALYKDPIAVQFPLVQIPNGLHLLLHAVLLPRLQHLYREICNAHTRHRSASQVRTMRGNAMISLDLIVIEKSAIALSCVTFTDSWWGMVSGLVSIYISVSFPRRDEHLQ